MTKYKEKKLDITADDKIFTPKGVGALNIGIVQCLSELVANSLDWRRLNDKEIKNLIQEKEQNPAKIQRFLDLYSILLEAESIDTIIKIQFNGDSIEIWDNGIGMNLKELEIGLKLRAASDTNREPLRSRKGMFGMGLKVGILGMGWKFTIRTRSLLDKSENEIIINTRHIENGKLKLKEVIGRIYDEYDDNSPLNGIESGTYIKIEDLHKTRHKPELWRQELGRNFSPEIQFEDVNIIVVDNSYEENKELEPCKPEVIDIFEETKINLDGHKLKVKSDNGDGTRGEPIQIKGWIALRKVSASGSGRWGIHTFRKSQLIESFHNDGPTNNGLLPTDPHPTIARIHGEIHLDMCDPNFTKMGWNTELKSWNDSKKVLKPVLEELVKAARAYRKNKKGSAKARNFIQKAKEMGKSVIEKISVDSEEFLEKEDSREYISIGNGQFIKISVTQQTPPNRFQFWDFSFNEESNEIAIFVNPSSTLWLWAQTKRNPEDLAYLIHNWAILDSLYFCMIHDLGIEPARAIDLRDKWHAKLYPEEGK